MSSNTQLLLLVSKTEAKLKGLSYSVISSLSNNKGEFVLCLLQDSPSVDVSHLMATIQGSFIDNNPLMLDAAVDNNVRFFIVLFS